MVIIQLGGWTIDPLARTISHGRRSRRVSPKAMRVLQELLDACGSVVPRGDLLDAAWPNVTVGEEALTQVIAELRRAFEKTSGRAAPLGTIYKAGYQLTEAASFAKSGQSSAEELSSFAPYLAARCLSDLDGTENARDTLRLYREALSSDPGSSGAHAGLALKLVCCRFRYGGHPDSLQQALDHARMAIRLDRSAPESYLAYGNTLAAMGDWRGAIPSFKTAIRLAPNLGETFQLLGIALFRTGAFEAAGAACDRAAALMPEDSGNLLRSARTRRALNDAAGSGARICKARGRVERLLAEEPDNVRARCQMFSCLIEMGEPDTALRRAEPVFGVADSAMSLLVGGLSKAGETDLALDQLEAAIEGGWNDAETLARDPDVGPLRCQTRFTQIVSHLH